MIKLNDLLKIVDTSVLYVTVPLTPRLNARITVVPMAADQLDDLAHLYGDYDVSSVEPGDMDGTIKIEVKRGEARS